MGALSPHKGTLPDSGYSLLDFIFFATIGLIIGILASFIILSGYTGFLRIARRWKKNSNLAPRSAQLVENDDFETNISDQENNDSSYLPLWLIECKLIFL